MVEILKPNDVYFEHPRTNIFEDLPEDLPPPRIISRLPTWNRNIALDITRISIQLRVLFSSVSVSVCTRRISIVRGTKVVIHNNRNPARAYTYTYTWKSKTPNCVEEGSFIPLVLFCTGNVKYFKIAFDFIFNTICIPCIFRKFIFRWNYNHDRPLCAATHLIIHHHAIHNTQQILFTFNFLIIHFPFLKETCNYMSVNLFQSYP